MALLARYGDNLHPHQRINGDDFIVGLDDAGVLRQRRHQLGLTQKQVADLAGILVKQYQRLESGERKILNASLRIALPVCAVLKLDPYEFFGNAEMMNRAIKVDNLEIERLPGLEIDFGEMKSPWNKTPEREEKPSMKANHNESIDQSVIMIPGTDDISYEERKTKVEEQKKRLAIMRKTRDELLDTINIEKDSK